MCDSIQSQGAAEGFRGPSVSSLVWCVLSMVTTPLALVGIVVPIIALSTTPRDKRHRVPRIVDWVCLGIQVFTSVLFAVLLACL